MNDDLIRRIWRKDASLWSQNKRVHKDIKNRLGWLNVDAFMQKKIKPINQLAQKIITDGFKNVVILGMGGSSLTPYFFSQVFGSKKDFPDLYVLDSTDPEIIMDYSDKLETDKTIFIIASKSGTTIESASLFKYFYNEVAKINNSPGSQFISITDRGTILEHQSKELYFRKNFTNPSDIGGRYSALSYFGMVPAALTGIDIERILKYSKKTKDKCQSQIELDKNPAWILGSYMGENVQNGKNKLTIIVDKKLSSFGQWLEQLIAESTGKQKTGIIPVIGEPNLANKEYSRDRFFVIIGLEGDTLQKLKDKATILRRSGFPVIEYYLPNPYYLGGEIFRWEIATAVCGNWLNINPFDEPNVTESKNKTNAILKKFAQTKRLYLGKPTSEYKQMKIYCSQDIKKQLSKSSKPRFNTILNKLFKNISLNGYLAILAYLPYRNSIEKSMVILRTELFRQFNRTVLFGFGPRYLHSIGQLYKGGPEEGAFLILTRKFKDEQNIPGEKYSFWKLQLAQALGDFQVLNERKRPVIQIHLPEDYQKAIDELIQVVKR